MKIIRANNRLLKKNEKVTMKSINWRSTAAVAIVIVMLAGLVGRLAYLQLINYEQYRNDALEQYTTEYTIAAHRGTLYDRNMTVLAKSISVETVFISPKHIKSTSETSVIADGLAEILGVDRATILDKASKTQSQYQIIKKNVDLATADLVRQFILDNDLSHCVHLEEGSKRYYYYGSLASHVIGFTGVDNQGIYGIERYYDDILKGVDGRVIKGQDGIGNDLDYKYESYIDAIDGSNMVLTIDWTIQSILEKYLQEAYDENNPRNRAMGVIMDVNTGEILAMSIVPGYDLNNPYTLDAKSQALLDSFAGTQEQVTTYKSTLLYQMWNNKVVSEPYETGSTFKVVTAAMALEEKVVDLDDTFVCPSSGIVVGGIPIHCHKAGGHGIQTFVEALQNSCNPSFVQIGLKIGNDLFYKYVDQFGYFEKTGIDIGDEASTIWHKNFNEVELAVSAFGQTFKVTPIAHIRALAAVANGGYLVTPHFAKALIDDDMNVIKTFEYDNSRQVVSQSVCDTIIGILKDGIKVGSTKNAYVEGYNIAAKTGTSEKKDVAGEDGFTPYVSSCIAYAPAEDPQIIIYIAIDEPTGTDYYGGLIAAPVISKVLTEVLPYMKIPKNNTDADNTYSVNIDDYRGMTPEEAKSALTGLKLNCKIVGEGSKIVDQLPRFGETISEGGKVILYTDDQRLERTISVPNLSGLSPSAAANKLIAAGLNIKITGAYQSGSGSKASSQSIESGSMVTEGTVIEVEFKYYEGID